MSISVPVGGRVPTRNRADVLSPWVLRTLLAIATVNVFAVLVALVADGDHQWDLFYTSLLLTIAGAVVIANAGVIEKGRAGPWPYAAVVVVCASAAFVIAGLWAEGGPTDSGALAKVTFIALTIGIIGTTIGLIAMPSLSDDWIIARSAAYVTAAALAVAISVAIIAGGAGSLLLWFALALVFATAIFAVALGSVVSKRVREAELLIDLTREAPNTELYGRIGWCPVCGAALGSEPVFGSAHQCSRCRTGFRVEITQRREVF